MRFLLALLLALSATLSHAQTMAPGRAYYIVNTYYDRVLSYGKDASTAALSVIGTNPEDSYIFDCIASTSQPGYVYLRQRSSGLWLAAINVNTWGMVLTTEQNSYGAWRVTGGTLSCYQSKSNVLGVDPGKENDTYVGVYYDKGKGDRSAWTFVEAVEGGYQASVEAAAKQAADAEANSKKTAFILSGDSLNLGTSYTLGLEGVRFKSSADSAIVVLRNNMGLGTTFVMHLNHITLSDGTKCLFADKPSKTTLVCSYRLTCGNGTLAIERNDSLLANVTVEPVPVKTTVGNDCEWSIMRSTVVASHMPVIYSRSKVMKRGEWETDNMGHHKLDVVYISSAKTLEVDGDLDVHFLRAVPFTGSCQVNILSDRARLIFDSCLPSTVRSGLSNIKVNGKAASTATNCRLGIYLNGAVVFATPQKPFIGYTGEQYQGDEIAVSALGATDLGEASNEMRSFILRRGYMAVLGSGGISDSGQEGYTRVYVADHEDLLVPVLPDALNRRVSSVHIKQWQYVSKKGWCSTKGNGTIANDMKKLGATWFYTWSADRGCTDDAEYIPIRQHIWWPSVSQIGGHASATACLMMNEPEHSEQHNDCDCKGAINEWNAYTYTPSMGKLGMRVGSPSPTDAGWLYNYIGHVDDMAARCDFVAIHCYWGTNEAANAQAWKTRLQEIYNKTKRPIWITEWNNGANWTSESWPSDWNEKLEKQRKAIKEIVAMLESLDFVERYAIYNYVETHRYVLYDDGGLTPAGREYRDALSTFAYNAKVQKVPNWWAPDVKEISVSVAQKDDGTAVFRIKNPNGDMTDGLWIEQQDADGVWQEVYRFNKRYVFDAEEQKVTLPYDDGTPYRVQLTTVRGKKKTVTLPALKWNDDKTLADASSYITNSDCTSGTDGWTGVSNVETKNGEASDGVASNWYFNIWKDSPYTSTMSQTLDNMPRGIYTLSAQLRGQEHMTHTLSLTGDSETVQQTFNGTGTAVLPGAEWLNGWQTVTTGEVQCLNGTLTIGFKVVNPSGAGWWSADHFTLTYRPDPTDEIAENDAVPSPKRSEMYDLSGRRVTVPHQGIYIQDGRKTLRR